MIIDSVRIEISCYDNEIDVFEDEGVWRGKFGSSNVDWP